MSGYLYKFVAFTIALATAGAQIVCACPTSALHQSPPPMTKACSGEKECCRKAEAKPVEPAKSAPCDKCNLKHRTQQAMPDRQAASVPHMDLVAMAPVLVFSAADVSSVQPRFLETSPPPPLLEDLFHVHSLLLN